MTAAPLARVLRALDAGAVDVRFVGGAVRNAVMELDVGEIDLATPDVPARVIERLAGAGLKAVPTGLDHGTVMAIADGATFEITTLRRDTACDGRHAAVEFTADWHEDARRRDFTMNALSLRPDGTLFDDHGGFDDAKAGRVRFVGDAGDRIQEDYLRILRLFRFFAWYGRVPLEPATLAACRAHASGLARLSAERIQQELVKLLSVPSPVEAITLMADCGVLQHVLPGGFDAASFARLVTLEAQTDSIMCDWLRRLAALLPSGESESVAAQLKLSNADRDRLKILTQAGPVLDDHTDPLHLRHALFRLGAVPVTDRILLAWSRRKDVPSSAPWRALLAAAAAWTPKTLPVNGGDVLALGVAAGPAVGRLLAAVEEWWIGAGFEPDRTQTLAHLQHLVGQSADAENKDGSGGGTGAASFVGP